MLPEDKRLLWYGIANIDITTVTPNEEIGDIDKVNCTIAMSNGTGPSLSTYTTPQLNITHAQLRVAGNSTALLEKKSINIDIFTDGTFATKVKRPILGLPSHDGFRIKANYQDKTLLREPFALRLCNVYGQEWAARQRLARVTINGDYRGLYWFTEKVSRDANRVNLPKLNVSDTFFIGVDEQKDIGYIDVAGGELATLDNEGRAHSTKIPDADEVTQTQHDYFVERLDQWNADPVGNLAMMDRNALIQYGQVMNFIQNTDANRNSWYTTMVAGGIMKMGPGWDLGDGALGNADGGASGTNIDHRNTNQEYLSQVWSQWGELLEDADFVADLRAHYLACLPDQNQLIQDLLDFIPKLIATGEPEANRARWQQILVMPAFFPKDTYQEEIDSLVEHIRRRQLWLEVGHYDPKPAKSAYITV